MKKIIIVFFVGLCYGFYFIGYADKVHKTDPMDEYNKTLILIGRKEYDKAIDRYKAIIEKKPDFIRAYKAIIKAYNYKKKPNEAIIYLKNLKNNNLENPCIYYGLGFAYYNMKQYNEAIKNFKRMVGYTDKIDNFDDSYMWMINSYLKKNGDKKKGIIEAELYLKKLLEDNPQNARTLFGLGYIYLKQHNWEKSLLFLNKALEIKPDFWIVYSIKSSVYYYTSKFKKVIKCLNILFREAEKIKEIQLQGIVIGNLGIIHRNLRNYKKALETSKKGLSICREIGDKVWEQRYLTNIGNIQRNLGEYDKALMFFQKALKINRNTGTKKSEGITLGNIGDVYYDLGNYKKALKFFNSGLLIHRETENELGIGVRLMNIGRIYHQLNKYSKALIYYKEAFDIYKEIGNRKNEGVVLGNIGYVYYRLGDYKRSLIFFKRALDINREIRNKKAEGIVLNYFGNTSLKLSQITESLNSYNKALKIGNQIKEPTIVWSALRGLASIYLVQKKYVKSLNCLKKAIQIIESIRGKLKQKEQKSSFLASKIIFYEDVICLLYKLHTMKPLYGYDKEYFFYIEKAKARVFLDSIQEAKINLKKNLSSEIIFEENRLTRKISKLQTELSKLDLVEQKRKNSLKKLNIFEGQYQDLILRIKRENPDYANVIYQKPYRFARIKKELLSKGTAIIEYFITRKQIFSVLLTPSDFIIHKFEASEIILERVSNYIELLSTKDTNKFLGVEAGKKIYNDLIGCFKGKLKSIKKLIIIPDRILHYLPFESLVLPTKSGKVKYLIEDYFISYAPSSSSLINLLSRKRRLSGKMEFLGFADPVYSRNESLNKQVNHFRNFGKFSDAHSFKFSRLLFSKQEIDVVSKYFPANLRTVYIREAAKEETLKETDLSKYKIIHFAMHGLFDEKTPSRSSLVFTLDKDPKEDGFFQMREIYDMELNADLVVLSACNTGRGKLERGEGVTGLYRTFLNVGAKSVLMSLWNINDKVTAEFMGYFYKNLINGFSKEESLQKVKIKMINTKYNHPFYWAAFVLNGDAGSITK